MSAMAEHNRFDDPYRSPHTNRVQTPVDSYVLPVADSFVFRAVIFVAALAGNLYLLAFLGASIRNLSSGSLIPGPRHAGVFFFGGAAWLSTVVITYSMVRNHGMRTIVAGVLCLLALIGLGTTMSLM